MTTIRYEFYRHANQFFTVIVLGLFAVSLLLASWYGTWAEAFVIGLPAAVVPIAISRAANNGRLSRIAYGIALMIFSALHIHQAHGLIEMHFGIFVSLVYVN